MPSFNKVILVGNLTRDPELRVTPKGTAICQVGIALNRSYKDESGTTRDDTTFVDCEAWGKTADLIDKYLSKGAPVLFEGRLKLDQWDDKQSGQKRSKLKVVVENVQFLGQRSGGEGASPAAAPSDVPSEVQAPHVERNQTTLHAPKTSLDDDIPF